MSRDRGEAGATRLVHIGPHKTGTTAIQGALDRARASLIEHGIIYAGEGRHARHAALAAVGRPALVGDRPPHHDDWRVLVDEVTAAADRRAVVSSEFFADGDDAAARRVVADLGGERVHVVVTLRPLAAIISSQWQQYLQNRLRETYEDWLQSIFTQPPLSKPTPTFWRRHRHDQLVERWAVAAGDPRRLTVIMVDESDRDRLLRDFESLLGLPTGLLVPETTATNRSLTLAEAELVRQLNHEFRDRAWPDHIYSRYLRFGAVEQLKVGRRPDAGEPRVTTPEWALEQAAAIGARAAERISALGVRVLGDLSALGSIPRPPATAPADGAPTLPIAAAVEAVVGAVLASGDTDPRAQRLDHRRVHDVTTAELMGVLVRRGGRRLGRTLRRER